MATKQTKQAVAIVFLPVVLLVAGTYAFRSSNRSIAPVVSKEGRWEPYLGSARSGVVAYQLGADFIRIEFRNRRVYTYSTARIHPSKIAHMKDLARAGEGLNTFINQNPDVRYGFDRE